MGQFRGLDPARVRELAGQLDSAAGAMVPLHRRLAQLLQAAAGDMNPKPVSSSPELEPVVREAVPAGVPLPLPTVTSSPSELAALFPWAAGGLAKGPMPASLDPNLRQAAADMRTRCDRLEQIVKATPLSALLDGAAQLDTLVDLNAVPQPNAAEADVRKWWDGLTPAQRDQYLYLKPDVLQTLRGLPQDVVDQAKQLAYFKVVPYKTSGEETKGSVKLTLGFFEIGEGFAFRTEQMSDGTYRVTMINNAQAGVKLKEGDDDTKLTLSGQVKLEVGDTWVFKDKAAADRLQQDIHQAFLLRQQEMAPDMNPMGVATMELDKILDRIGEPAIKMGKLGTEAQFELGLGSFTNGVKFNSDVSTITSTVDPKRPTVTTSYDFTVENTGALAQGKGKFEGTAVTAGSVQVTRDKNNPDPNTNIVSINVIQSVEDKLGLAFDEDAKVVSGSYKKGGTSTHVVSLNVPIGASAQEQAAARQWLARPTGLAGPGGAALTTPMIPTGAPPPDADAFTRLAHSRGRVTDVQYAGTTTDLKLGATLKLEGITFGFEAAGGNKEEHVTGQRYLGAPDPQTGERRFVPLP
ncbi:hypothetical protein FM076_27480 [Streptomyces albus subsp. chlorinus]|uniref:hypothetical protein n=1 Tax=Streptomyces albus TaxID=1888 RepID=UPI001570CDEB|nr:hypothetical protein [Streptomyces albus]NSC24695.1 hypothetical protein [Streptomyces albus subsp. chlorinus]